MKNGQTPNTDERTENVTSNSPTLGMRIAGPPSQLGVAVHLAKFWALIVGISLSSLLLVVMIAVFVLTAAGFGSIDAELEVAGRNLALPAHLVPWVSAFLLTLFGWQIWVLFRHSTKTYFRAE